MDNNKQSTRNDANKRQIMDGKICPAHRQVVAKLVAALRHDCKIPDEVYQFLITYYGTEEINITNKLRRSMNSHDLITKQDKRYPNKSSSRS